MNPSPLRLAQARWKVAYIVVGLAVGFGVNLIVSRLEMDVLAAACSALIQFAWMYFATKIFRWKNEMLLAPRPR